MMMRRGSTMVAVFWVMAILGMVLFGAVRLLYLEVDLVSAYKNGTRARQLAEMGISLAANTMVKRGDPILTQVFDDGLEGFQADIRSEGDKFDINFILRTDRQELDQTYWLRKLFVDWGMEPEDADDLTDALVDWVDPNDLVQLHGAEKAWYEREGYEDRPYNRPFYSLDEMKLVRGMELLEVVNPNWESWFTIWTGAALDINEASAQFIAAAAEVPIERAVAIPEQVRGEDELLGTEDDVRFTDLNEAMELLGVSGDLLVEKRFTLRSTVRRLESIGWAGEVKRKVTLVLQGSGAASRIYERTEEVVE